MTSKMKSFLLTQLIIGMEIKKIGLIRAYFIFSFYNVKRDENIHLKNGEKLKVKKGCYTKRDIENVSAKKLDMTH